MAALVGCLRALRVMVLVSLLSQTAQFGFDELKWDELTPDVASLHRLMGLPDRVVHQAPAHLKSSRMKRDVPTTSRAFFKDLWKCENVTECVIQNEQVAAVKIVEENFRRFMEKIERSKIEDKLLLASELSYTYRNKLILIMDQEMDTLQKAQQEYSEDPHYSIKVDKACIENDSCAPTAVSSTIVKIFGRTSDSGDTLSGYSGSTLATQMLRSELVSAPVFSIDGNTSAVFQNNFMRIFKPHGITPVLEIATQNDHIYQVMDQSGRTTRYQVPKRPVDHTTQYDWQNILILEDDPTVRKMATFLYEKHPTVSSVYILENQEPKLIKGEAVPLSQDSRLVVVGHGKRDGREMKVGGYRVKEVAEIISQMDIDGNQIKTTSMVASELGSDAVFISKLLKELHARSIDTELHLQNGLLQISPSKKKITVEMTPDGIVRRQKDHNMKTVAWLDKNGEAIIQVQSCERGEPIFSNERNFLILGDEEHWPTNPRKFVLEDARQDHTSDFEALAWGFFHKRKNEDLINLLTHPTRQSEDKYVINDAVIKKVGKVFKQQQRGWINSDEDINRVLENCYEIESGEDILNIITHYTTFSNNDPKWSYLMLHDWIYQIAHGNIYGFPAGKRFSNIEKGDIEKENDIKKYISDQSGKEEYRFMKGKIETFDNGKRLFAEYAVNTLQGTYIKGSNKAEMEAWFGTYFIASIISESSRNFRTFPSILMALDMSRNLDNSIRETGIESLFEGHPLARGGTWISSDKRGFFGSSTVKTEEKEKHKKINKLEKLKKVTRAEEKIYLSWNNNNNGEDEMIEHLLHLVSLNDNEQRESVMQNFKTFKHEINQNSPNVLGGSYDGHVTSQDMQPASEVEHTLKLSSHYSRSSNVLSDQIESQLERDFGAALGELKVKPGSVRVEDGEFHCQLQSENSPETLDWKVALPEEAQRHMETLQKNIRDVAEMNSPDPTKIHRSPELLERTGKAVGTVGLMLGMQGAACRGDIENGVMGTLQTVHGITAMTLAALGKTSVTSETKVMEIFMKSPVGRMTLNIIPIVGIGFGIYNVVEESQRIDILGIVDGALDLAVLDNVETCQPKLEPIKLPLPLAISGIRMGIDDDYIFPVSSVQNELANLPENPGILILTLIGAVPNGLGMGIFDFTFDMRDIFYTIPYQEIEEGRRLVEQISDYHKYYTFREVQAGRKAIDFSSGDSSWNGGGITFCLAEEGFSEFCMENFVSSDESLGRRCWEIETKGTNDIVLGTGESHELTYTDIQLKVFLFIPADHETVVSGYKKLSNTLYGTYYGNDKKNNFFASQSNNDNHAMEVMLHYYYELYGKKGSDSFYLGPQRSHVEGQGGKDIYIIPETGGNTYINNYDPDKATDLLILSVNYMDISVTKSGNDVILQYLTDHNVRILNWFLGEEYRHLNMMSADGVLFDINPTVISSVKLIALGVNKMSKTQGQFVNACEPLLLSVTNIVGSPHNDRLIGNSQKNVIDGGGGTDYVKGGEGEDIYVVNGKENSKVYIENHSHDNETDMLITDTNLHDFIIKIDGNDLILMTYNWKLFVTLENWFRSEMDRHLLVVTKDLVTFTISEDKVGCTKSDLFKSKCILSQSINYSKSKIPLEIDMQSDEAFQSVTQVYGSNLDDTIKGNAKRNTIMPGRGNDFLQGFGEEDWYVVAPGHGLKIIDNYSPDTIVDTLLLRERYELISCRCQGVDLSIFINETKEILLKGWFKSKQSQHLQIQSSDGITFKVIGDLSQCSGQLKFPQSVDYRNSATGQTIFMDEEEFATVVKMYGSPVFDLMVGNDNDNLLDPFTGGAQMMGKEGTDSYIVKPEYGMNLRIDNFALDEKVDTVLFKADFISGQFTVQAEEYDVLVSTTEKGQKMQVRLINYSTGRQNRHLSFQSHDGVFFWVKSPVINSTEKAQTPWIEPYKVKLLEKQTDCRIDLNLHAKLSTVHTVQGCLYQSNHILGNRQENALFGGMKDDALEGGPGHDTLMGGQGSDILKGNSGDDTFYGEEGNDTMLGGSGADVFVPGLGADLVDGGSGRDTVLYQGDHEKGEGVYVNLLTGECRQADAEGDVLKDIENVIGTIYSDVLISGSESTLLKGSDGNDILVSVNGGDYLVGGEGKDIYLLVSRYGLLTINNCADDNFTDILYLDFLSQEDAVRCSQTSGWLSLTFSGSDGSVVEVRLMEWLNSGDKCGHLTLILREGATSIDKLQICQRNDMLMYLVRAVAVATVATAAVVHVIGILFSFLKCVRRNKEVNSEGRPANNEGEAGLERSEDVGPLG